jgi:hydrogenase maturation protease
MRKKPRIVIAGVGNLVLRDDGVGVHAVRALQENPIPGVELVDIGTAILHGLPLIETAERVLVIDAVKGGQPAGTIYLFDATGEGEMPSMVSVHSMGLREAMRILSPQAAHPAITVLGVEPAALGYGLDLSEQVQKAMPQVLRLARQTVQKWMDGIREQCEAAA